MTRCNDSVVATTKKPAVAVGRNKSGRVWKNTKQRCAHFLLARWSLCLHLRAGICRDALRFRIPIARLVYRFSKVVNVKSLKKTYEKHKQEREERARMKDYENELKEAAKVKREVCFFFTATCRQQ